MKKTIGLVLIFLALWSMFSLYAQQQDTKLFVKTVSIIKVYSHSAGYKILYLKSTMDLGEFYVPMHWFTSAGGKGEIVWGDQLSYPYFSIFWVDGKYDHIRLYLHKNLDSESWGMLKENSVDEGIFEIEELNLEF